MAERPRQRPNPQDIAPQERPKPEVPTTLHLFLRSPLDQERVLALTDQATHLETDFAVANNAMGKLNNETIRRFERIGNAINEIKRDIPGYHHSGEVGLRFIELHNLFSPQGYSDTQIMSVFEACLRMRIRLERIGITGQQTRSQLVRLGNRDRSTDIERILEEEAETVPSWFTQSQYEWKRLLRRNAVLAFGPLPLPLSFNTKEGSTFEDELPDWYEELKPEEAPDLQTIRDEMAQGHDTLLILDQSLANLQNQVTQLDNQAFDKLRKSGAFFEKRRRQFLASIQTIDDLVVFLHATRNIAGHIASPEEIREITTRNDYHVSLIQPEPARRETIRKFAENNSPQTLALWIEQNLREGGIAENAQTIIDQRVSSLLSIMVDEPVQQANLQALRTIDKKAFQVINYELSPLINLLSTDEKAYLKELITTYEGEPVEAFIWDMADLISTRLIDTPDISTLPNQTAITLRHVREFMQKWLRNNWEWAHGQITETISKKQRGETEEVPLPNEVDVIELKTGTTDEETNQQIEEIEEAITEVRKSNLGRYKLFYKFDRDDPLDRAIPIEGESLDEFSDTLTGIIGRYGISCSVKPSSIINSLDHLLELSSADREKATRITLNGKLYHRAKRQAVRIFFDLLEDDGTFALNIYQKKAQEYKR